MLHSVSWSEPFAAAIRNASGLDHDYIRREILANTCQAWAYVFEGVIVGHLVTRIETDTLVVVCYEGSHVREFGYDICKVAETMQLPYARFHTQQPGLIRLLKEFEPEPLEYVIRINTYGRS